MSNATTWFKVRQLPTLLRGDTNTIHSWIERVSVSRTLIFLAVITLGTGAFGAAIGFWRAPMQGVFSAIKLPLVILLTTFSNALLNGMLAPLLGLNIGFRQSLSLILMSFVIASAILGSFAPLVLFMIWNLPPVSARAETISAAYSFMQLALAGIIAFAGIMANWRLFPLLNEQADNRSVARRVLLAWLVGNLFLGSQICWMLRPIVGKPDMPLEFLGSDVKQGNFFETIFVNVRDLLASPMNNCAINPGFRQIPVLLRGETETIQQWLNGAGIRQIILFFVVIVIGSASYGAAIGLWRDPLQAFYTALKFPLLILLTTFGNALLNGMLAPLFGLNIGFRQSFLAIVMSFTIAAAILCAFSPLAIFLVWNTPPIAERAHAFYSHSVILLTHVTVIAFAGIAANLRLLQLLQQLSGSSKIGWKILLGWLAGNLFLGSQLSWILRPFVGSPNLPVQFLREDALSGNFYEAVFHAIRHLFF